MQVDFGRLLIVTVGAAGAKVDLDLAGVRGIVTLVDADSAVAITAKQVLLPGSDPQEAPPIPVVEIFSTHGRVTWDEVDKPRVDIPARHVRIYAGPETPETYGPYAPPEWIDPKSIPPIDRESADAIERMLPAGKPLNLSLAEMLEHRQVNVRALAARCLGFLGEFEPLIKELSDPRQYPFWQSEFQALRHAMQRGPETAARLKVTLDRLRPDQAADLYRMLCSYSNEQLESGDAARLVKHLESEHMDVRVLAFQNLWTITGAMEFYMPQKKPEDLRGSIQGWKSRLEKGTIIYKAPPTAIEPYKPLDKPPAAATPLSAPKGAVGPL
jgi:hypothetical protein